MATSRLHELSALGQSIWVDNLSRDLVQTGALARAMAEDAVVGVTSNPTIFQKALAQGDAYDTQMRELLSGDDNDIEVFFQLAGADVAAACDVLRPVYDETGGLDGYVSLEVDPRLALDTDATVAQAIRLHEMVDRPNLMVKIPATREGLPAVEEMIARGKSINVTLIFSLERYRAVAEAYLRGLERLVEGGGDPRPVASVASFFVSRVDTETDRRLTELGGHDHLKGRLAVANAKLAYQDYLGIFSGERWDALRARGATPQRCLWASTSTKDPSYRDVLYVEELIGPDTVNTMPPETIVAFQDHGVSEVRLTQGIEDSHTLLTDLAAAGIDYADVTDTLEQEGVEKFEDSFRDLLAGIAAKRTALVRA